MTESSELAYDLVVSYMIEAVSWNDRILLLSFHKDRCPFRDTYQIKGCLNERRAIAGFTGVVNVLKHCDYFSIELSAFAIMYRVRRKYDSHFSCLCFKFGKWIVTLTNRKMTVSCLLG